MAENDPSIATDAEKVRLLLEQNDRLKAEVAAKDRRIDELEAQRIDAQRHIMDVLMPALKKYHQLDPPKSGSEWADAAIELGDVIIVLHEMMGTLTEASKSPRQREEEARAALQEKAASKEGEDGDQ